MSRIQVESADRVVEVVTNSKDLIKMLQEESIPRTIIPGMEITSGKSTDFTLNINVGNEEGIHMDSNTLHINYPRGKRIPKYPFAYALFYAFNRAYQEADIYHLHGSAISKDGQGLLILGHEDYGKSRISLKLCLDYGFTLNGDETILVGPNLNVIEGGNLIQISRDKLKHYFPDKNIVPKEFNEERDKLVLDSKDLGIFGKPGSKISKIIYGHVCPYTPRFVQLEEGDAKRRIFEAVSENIRGHGYVLFDINNAYPSLDTEALSKKRVSFVNRFVNSGISVYNARDNLENICGKIAGLC